MQAVKKFRDNVRIRIYDSKTKEMNHLKGILLYILAFVALATFVLAFASCATPNPKKQKKHYDKFIHYGGKIDTVERTITITQVVKGRDGKDSLIYVDVPIQCPEATIEYKDRWHIRRLDRQEKDSLKRLYDHNEKMLKLRTKFVSDSLQKIINLERAKKNTAKKENPKGWSNPWIWVIIIGMITASIYLIKKG
jgi:hypothetical protein